MKKHFLLFAVLTVSFGFFSCSKDKEEETPAPNNQLYMNFTLDSVPVNVTGTTNQLNTGFGGGSYTSSAFFTVSNLDEISLSIPQDSILGSDLQALVGQKIPIGSCGGCPTNIEVTHRINGDDYESTDTYNPYPAYYVQFNSVAFCQTVVLFGQSLNEYYVTGEFKVRLNYGSDIKNADNGTFRMIFQEVKN